MTAGRDDGADAAGAGAKVSIVALDLVDKQDLSGAEALSGEEQHAVRAIAGGAEDQELVALVLAVMERARAGGLWLGCDCRSEGGRRPLVAPCRNHRGTDYWRVLAGRHLAHDEGCVFRPAHALFPADRSPTLSSEPTLQVRRRPFTVMRLSTCSWRVKEIRAYNSRWPCLSWYLPEVLTKSVPVPRACEGGA